MDRMTDSGTFRFHPKRSRGELRSRVRAYPPMLIRRAIEMSYKMGVAETAELMGVKETTIHQWKFKRFLPKAGRYCFAEWMDCMRLAKGIYAASRTNPVKCVQIAAARKGMNWNSVKVYIYFQAVPTVVGFSLYADRIVNLKAEQYGLGLRRYAAVLGVDHPDIEAEIHPPTSLESPTGKRSVPRQLGRRYVVELQVTSLIPARKHVLH